jgi:hypothetical protein
MNQGGPGAGPSLGGGGLQSNTYGGAGGPGLPKLTNR